MLAVHRNAAVKGEATDHKRFPVSTMKVHPWLLGYIGNPSVEWVDGNTLYVWNSAAHKKMMNQPEVMR